MFHVKHFSPPVRGTPVLPRALGEQYPRGPVRRRFLGRARVARRVRAPNRSGCAVGVPRRHPRAGFDPRVIRTSGARPIGPARRTARLRLTRTGALELPDGARNVESRAGAIVPLAAPVDAGARPRRILRRTAGRWASRIAPARRAPTGVMLLGLARCHDRSPPAALGEASARYDGRPQ